MGRTPAWLRQRFLLSVEGKEEETNEENRRKEEKQLRQEWILLCACEGGNSGNSRSTFLKRTEPEVRKEKKKEG